MTAGSAAGTRREATLTALLVGVATGAILVPLNTTMLAVALPGIMAEFGLGAHTASSVVTLYLGAVAVSLPVAGALGDRYGHRRVFLVGVLAFGAASLLAAVGQQFATLQLARVFQAVSGGMVSTASASIIRETAPEERRGEAFGLFDLLTSVSAAAGPFVGGLLVGAFGWRSIFTLAVPIALLSAVVVGVLLAPTKRVGAPGRARPLDVPGLVLLGAMIVAFLLAIALEAPAARLGALALAGLLLAAFVAVELRTDRPAVDPRLFRSRTFASAVAGVFGATVILHGTFILVPLLVEDLYGGSAAESGLVLFGIAGVGAIVAPFGGRASDRFGRRLLVVRGSLIMAAGLAALAIGVDAASALLVGVLLGVVGLGFGLSGAPRQTAALDAVEHDRVGMAAGTYLTGRYLGGVVGASLGGAVLGGSVTTGAMTLGFAILAVVGVAVAGVSTGLPGRATPSREPVLA